MGADTAFTSEHGEIHDRLVHAAREPGPIGEAARRVERFFDQHAAKEERLVAPLLELLPRVARHKPDSSMARALPLFDEFSGAVDDMISEHHVISAALEALVAAAHAADRPEFAALAARLVSHMRLEETVIYPAALLLGKHLRLRLGPD
jgi:iron-sulfur cluster repair protein YtfE (RIC family)